MGRDGRRALGKRLVWREVQAWRAAGWILDENKRWVFTRQGMRSVTVTDYFGRYDFLAAWPERGILVGVQVSAEGESKHKPPLGFPLTRLPGLLPDDLMTRTWSEGAFSPGVYEVYVYYRQLKARRNAWTPDRRWWLLRETVPIATTGGDHG